jgi:hypothetical protein
MRKSLWIILTILVVAVGAPIAHADTVFDVSGTARATNGQVCGADCAFSGTLTVNTTTGAVTGIDITFPGISGFTTVTESGLIGGTLWGVDGVNSGSTSQLNLAFTPNPGPGTLVGLTGGTISGSEVESLLSSTVFFNDLTGTVSAVTAPEPSSLGLMLLGIGLVFAMRKRAAAGFSQAS